MPFGLPTDLCAAEDVTAYLGPTSSDAMAELANLVSACSDYIRNFCTRDFIATTYTEPRDGTGTNRLMLSQYPVSAVSALVVDGQPWRQRAQPRDGGWVLVPPNALRLDGGCFPAGVANVQVTYTAGWAQAALPRDLVQACVEAVALRWKERARVGERSKTISVAGGHETVAFVLDDFTPFGKSVLARYQKVVPL